VYVTAAVEQEADHLLVHRRGRPLQRTLSVVVLCLFICTLWRRERQTLSREEEKNNNKTKKLAHKQTNKKANPQKNRRTKKTKHFTYMCETEINNFLELFGPGNFHKVMEDGSGVDIKRVWISTLQQE
jgi:hypothetical protein